MLLFAGLLLAAAAVANGQTCGGSLTVGEDGSVTIQSPNYPNAYPPNARCTWTVSGPAGKGLHFSASAFNLEGTGSSCNYDYLKIGEEQICGPSFPSPLVTRSPVTIQFASDSSIQYTGFSVSISAGPLPVAGVCGGDVTVEDGKTAFFLSPNYPAAYGNNANCQYTITGPAGKGLQFNTAVFDTESTYDNLQFTEIVNGVSKTLGPFSGTSGPNKLRTSTNQVSAVFRSDASVTKRGFNVTVKADICPGQTTCPNDATRCISSTQFCDGVEDCAEGVDEQHCNAECGRAPIQPNLELTKNVNEKIVGGAEAVAHSWPWQVAFLSSGGSQICGGTVIHRNWVMTAAHCCVAYSPSPSSYKVKLGAHNLNSPSEESAKVHNIKRLIMHPSYGSSPATRFDFCLLELEESAALGRHIVPACLATAADDVAGNKCFVTGWGNTGPRSLPFDDYLRLVQQAEAGKIPKELAATLRGTNVLNQVDVNLSDQSYCNTQYGGVIQPNMICAAASGKDTCQGDSGGPLVCQRPSGEFALVGVTSWGRGCASPGYPGVYGRISDVIPWITETMFS